MANAILQQTSQELAQQIETELLENPALDVIEDGAPCKGDCVDSASCPFCSQQNQPPKAEYDLRDVLGSDHEYFTDSPSFDSDEEYDPLGNLEAEVTMQEHLRSVARSVLPEEDHLIAEYLINCLDDNGWLDTELDAVALDLGVSLTDCERVLKVIQSLDPPGIGARDLQECLQIQLAYLAEEGNGNPAAERIVRFHFKDVVNRRYPRIARSMGMTLEKTRETLDFIRTQLNPHPAGQFRPPWAYKPAANKSTVRPDVVIRRTEFGYDIEIGGFDPTVLGVNPSYQSRYSSIKSGNGNVPEDERKHVAEYVERAELFIRNIHQRRKTLRLITTCIVECQQGFLETGSRAYVRPLTRTRVAEMLGIHESTVSRATANKFVQLPNLEVVAFEIFFNASLSIKTAIEEIIANENPSHPLSDQQIAEVLKERGIEVARRTVVKYREAQKLLSSNRRRR